MHLFYLTDMLQANKTRVLGNEPVGRQRGPTFQRGVWQLLRPLRWGDHPGGRYRRHGRGPLPGLPSPFALHSGSRLSLPPTSDHHPQAEQHPGRRWGTIQSHFIARSDITQVTCSTWYGFLRDFYHMSNLREFMGVNGEALQLYSVYKIIKYFFTAIKSHENPYQALQVTHAASEHARKLKVRMIKSLSP